MKAIACPQCGALVKTVSPGDKLESCDYCKAKIILTEDRERPVNDSERDENNNALPPYEQFQENYRKVLERAKKYDAPYTYPQKERDPVWILFVLVVIGILLITITGANSKSCLSRPLGTEEKTPPKILNSPK